tara:strand:- start:149 stop:433 length:285 start_codon:yes stop_codon:yes gene_type:complete
MDEFTPIVIDKSDEQFKKEIRDVIDKIIDREENDMGAMYLLELLSLEHGADYRMLQSMVDLKRSLLNLSINNISHLLLTSLDDPTLTELKGLLQ